MATKDELTAEATTEIEAAKPLHVGTSSGNVEFTDAEYDQAVTDRAAWKLDSQDNDYSRARQQSYAAIGDQLDMLYHDMAADKGDKTGDWFAAVKKVKDDNPKPS